MNYFQIFFAELFYQLLRIVEEQNGFGLFDFGFSFKSFHESQQGKGENLSTTSTRLTDTSTGSKPSSQHNHGTWFMKSWKSWIVKIKKSLNHEDKDKNKLSKLRKIYKSYEKESSVGARWR